MRERAERGSGEREREREREREKERERARARKRERDILKIQYPAILQGKNKISKK